MTTVVEALQAATDELHNAALLYQSRADAVAANLAATTQNAQTIIQNFQNRAPSIGIFINENTGIDAPGRGGSDKPYKTVDYALDNADVSVNIVCYLFSDVTIRKWRSIYAAIGFVGFAPVPSAFGWQFSYAQRKMSFLGEAINSPRLDVGRVLPFFDLGGGGTVNFTSIDIVMPTAAAGINYPNIISSIGRQIVCVNCSLSCETAGSSAVFITPNGGQVVLSFSGTIGANAPGKIFSGVAAGVNPNTVWNYRSNLTSA